MTGSEIFRFTLQGLVFAVWAVMLFSVLFKLRRRAEAETGRPFHGPGMALKQWGIWFRSPADRKERNTVLFLTFALLVMSATQAMTV